MTTNNENITNWSAAASELDAVAHPQLPHHVLMGEAVDVARFLESHWETKRDAQGQIVVPGLDLAAKGGGLAPELAQEILELQDATQGAQTLYRLTVPEPGISEMDRAEYVLGETRSTLEFLFDDDVSDANDVRLDRLQAAHGYPKSQDAMAAALEEYAALAAQNREDIEGLGGFDTALIDEAAELVTQQLFADALAAAGRDDEAIAIALKFIDQRAKRRET